MQISPFSPQVGTQVHIRILQEGNTIQHQNTANIIRDEIRPWRQLQPYIKAPQHYGNGRINKHKTFQNSELGRLVQR
jgi:hypothetical protein